MNRRVLIMEDNTTLALEWKDAFELNSCEVVLTANGEDAVAYLDSEEFDLVITDLFVNEGKGGLHVLLKLNMMHGNAPPAIAVTGSFAPTSSKSDADGTSYRNLFLSQAERLGSSLNIQKPFPAGELVAIAQGFWE